MHKSLLRWNAAHSIAWVALGLLSLLAVNVLLIVSSAQLQYWLATHESGSQILRDFSFPHGKSAFSTAKADTSPRLTIPSIGVDTPIVEGKTIGVLDKETGVWHQTGGPRGNLVLAGHRFKYLPPNTSTLYNVHHLRIGDVITVGYAEKDYSYHISRIDKVTAKSDYILFNTDHPQLTIYTCDFWQPEQRIVVIALQ